MTKLKKTPSTEGKKINNSRKEMRKEQRQMKKQLKSQRYENIAMGRKTKRQVAVVLSNMKSGSPLVKPPVVQSNANEKPKLVKKVTFSGVDEIKKNRPSKQNFKEKLDIQMKLQRKRQLLDAVKEDDKEIKSLEKKLKITKNKNKATCRGFVQCGLDYILDVCDPDRIKSGLNNEVPLENSDTEFLEDISQIKSHSNSEEDDSLDEVEEKSSKILKNDKNYLSRNNKIYCEDEEEVESDEEEDNEEEDNDEEEQAEEYDNEEEEEEDDDEEEMDVDMSEAADSDLEMSSNEPSNPKLKINEVLKEDIYGRLRDSKGNVVKSNQEKYVPPHLRYSKSSEVDKAKRQLKGLLNRLAQQNMYSIANEVESSFSKHSRNDINEIIIELTLSNVVLEVVSPERLIIDHAMLISILHANVGTEVGAYMLQRFIELFISMLSEKHEVENKKPDNILYLISYMYSFKIFEECLMYDLLLKLCDDCTEKNVDLILVVLKSIGFALRKDNPVAMKQFLLCVQKKCIHLSVEDNSRLKYLLEVLVNIKNNNIAKLSGFDLELDELKKALKTFVRKGNSIVPLRIRLEEILKAPEHGRWWIIGSAWKNENQVKSIKENNDNKDTYSKKLLLLAKKQRMNTDNRRNIFCILMSSEDYKDAFEKLIRLGLKGHQEREIILVIIHCLLEEKKYNPFYALVADQMCESSRRHLMSLQCGLWDRFKEINSLTSDKIHILAKFLAELLVMGSLPISVLKVMEFSELDKPQIKFLRQTLLSVANEINLEKVKDGFLKVSKAKNLSLFRDALRLFIHHFILKNLSEGDLKERLQTMCYLLSEVD